MKSPLEDLRMFPYYYSIQEKIYQRAWKYYHMILVSREHRHKNLGEIIRNILKNSDDI
jgi:hypothetical protein